MNYPEITRDIPKESTNQLITNISYSIRNLCYMIEKRGLSEDNMSLLKELSLDMIDFKRIYKKLTDKVD